MNRRANPLMAALFVSLIAAPSCGRREGVTALFILEELEAASAVKNPARRIERLDIFAASHADHPYRDVAYERTFDAITDGLGDDEGAMRYVREKLAVETDPGTRGSLQLLKFRRLFETNHAAALRFADSLRTVERSPRLFMMIGYYCVEEAEDLSRAAGFFLRAAELSAGVHARSQAHAMAASALEAVGEREEARRYLETASGNPEADRMFGEMLWEEGKRDEAIERFVACVARMPGARGTIKLDSLYALARPGDADLDRRITAARIADLGPLPAEAFVDLDGKRHDFSKLRGTKLVIYALSPT